MEKYVETFEGTESAPASDDIERSSSLLAFPVDFMRNVVGSERLNVRTECCGSPGVINTLSHMSLVSFLEPNSATSVGLSFVVVSSCDTVPVHHVTVLTLVRHETLSLVSTITVRDAS